MVRLKKNYLDLIERGLTSKEIKANWSEAVVEVKKGYQIMFVKSIHMLLSKICYTATSAVIFPRKTLNNNFYKSFIENENRTFIVGIELVCVVILQDKKLYHLFRSTYLNEQANILKHSLDPIGNVELENILKYYNRLLKQLDERFRTNKFSKLIINKPNKVSFKNPKHEDYFMFESGKFTVSFRGKYIYDKFTKMATLPLHISWEEFDEARDRYNVRYKLFITVYHNNNKILVYETKEMDEAGKEQVIIEVNASGINNNKVSIQVVIDVVAIDKKYYESGALFWKKYHVHENKNIVMTKRLNLTTDLIKEIKTK